MLKDFCVPTYYIKNPQYFQYLFAGGSNGYRGSDWKLCLQELANTTGLCISVCHFPLGTRSLHKIEHRMFCHISENWRGKPLSSLAVVINLISNTKTDKGLHIKTSIRYK